MSTRDSELEGPWDLVVVGHGAAGLSAAAAFLEAYEGTSPHVAVLDRASIDERGGSTAWTTAVFRLDNDGQLAADWADIVRSTSGELANEGYIENFYEHAVDTLNWIRKNGVKVAIMRNTAPPLVPWGQHTYALQGGGRAFVDTYSELIQGLGARCFYNVDLVRLNRAGDGPVTGVVVRDADDVERTMVAKRVVLSCGGFEGDRAELGRRLPGGDAIDTVSTGTRVNTGAGIRAAVEVGAAKAGQYDGTHLEPVDPRATEVTEPVVLTWLHGILVNPSGKRFIDEAGTQLDILFDWVAKGVLAQGGLAYAINDAAVRAADPRFAQLAPSSQSPVRADTLRALAEQLGIDPDALEDTVAEYNASSVDTPYDATILDHKHTVGIHPPKSHYAQPLLEPPFEAWPIGVQICFTFEGLKVGDTTQVLDTQDRPIEGLHAAGEIVGIFHGDTYPAGTSVLRALTFGRLAGHEVASSLAAEN